MSNTDKAPETTLKVYTLEEVANMLNVSYRSLLTYLKTGKIKGVKIGKTWRISQKNLERFINGEDI